MKYTMQILQENLSITYLFKLQPIKPCPICLLNISILVIMVVFFNEIFLGQFYIYRKIEQKVYRVFLYTPHHCYLWFFLFINILQIAFVTVDETTFCDIRCMGFDECIITYIYDYSIT